MNFSIIKQALILLPLLFLLGCAHPIVITPNLSQIDRKDVTPIDKNVGYHISKANMEKSVITPGGGGDKVEYTPYKDIEPALQKVLSNLFSKVLSISNPDDHKFLADNDISFVFIPTVDTSSSSSGIITWMATDFTLKLDCKAIDRKGVVVWKDTIEKSGHATYDEMADTGDFQLSAKRASEAVFLMLQEKLNSEAALRINN